MKKLRFSIAGLLVVMTGASIWFAKISHDAREQATGVKEVEASQGIVQFQAVSAPPWLISTFGEDYFRDEISIDFATNQGRQRGTDEPKATDKTLVILQSLTNVETIELGNNREVTDAGLEHFAGLKNLKTLYLYKTGVQGPGLIHLEQLPNLASVSFGKTNLNDSGMKYLGNITGLTWLRLNNTKVTDKGMADLVSASLLNSLSLDHTAISDTGLVHLEQLSHLEYLGLLGTNVTVNGVERLRKKLPSCNVVTTFGLGVTPQDELLFADGIQPTAQEINARLKELNIDGKVETDSTKPGNPIVTLRLFECTLSDRVVLSLIQRMPDLEILSVRGGLVGDDFLHGIESLNLSYLSLEGTRVTDDGLMGLSKQVTLQELILNETNVTDAGLRHLEHLSSLNLIMLSTANVTAKGVERLRQSIPNCRIQW